MSNHRRGLPGLFGRFAVVGVNTAMLHYGILFVLVQWAGLDSTLASSLGFVVAVSFNYFMHYYWTFSFGTDADPVPHGRALVRYACMIAGGFLLNALVMYTSTDFFAWHYLLAQLLAFAVVISWNFTLANAWVFRS